MVSKQFSSAVSISEFEEGANGAIISPLLIAVFSQIIIVIVNFLLLTSRAIHIR